MLSLESCREHCRLLDFLASDKAEGLLQRLPYSAQEEIDVTTLQGVARDFASLFYSLLIQQMQKTLPSDDQESVISQGAQGFFSMFLPQAVAGQADDPLARYLFEQLGARYGEVVDERV